MGRCQILKDLWKSVIRVKFLIGGVISLILSNWISLQCLQQLTVVLVFTKKSEGTFGVEEIISEADYRSILHDSIT